MLIKTCDIVVLAQIICGISGLIIFFVRADGANRVLGKGQHVGTVIDVWRSLYDLIITDALVIFIHLKLV